MSDLCTEKEDQLLLDVFILMQPRINKMLRQTAIQNRNDLEQDIKLKVISAVKTKRIQPISFFQFKERFDEQA